MSQILLRAYKSRQISKKKLLQIFKLKSIHWQFSLNEQKKWFDKNIRTDDIHLVLLKNQKVIGYNCLRKYKIESNHFYLFDTLVIDTRHRGKGYSSLIMNMSCNILKRKRLDSILFCNSNLVKFYLKYGWEKKIISKIVVKKGKNLLKFNKSLY